MTTPATLPNTAEAGPDLEARRARERAKYLHLAETSQSYGASNHGKAATDWVLAARPGYVADFGCGRNQFVRTLRDHGVRGVGIDLAFPEADIRAPVHAVPLPDSCADVTTSFDVLEHLLEDEVPEALAEMRRIARPGGRFVLTVSDRPSKILALGENLHPTVQPESWWLERIADAGGRVERPAPELGGVRLASKFIAGVWA